MEEAGGRSGEAKKTGLEGTGLSLPGSSHGNLRSAGSDQQLKQTLDSLKSSRSPAVINYGASWCRVCSQILPSFCKFSNEFKNLTFIYADIDECPDTTQTYDTLQPSIFTGMEKKLMRCLVQEKRDCMIGYGYIPDSSLPFACKTTDLLHNSFCISFLPV
ncbi:hypothetical protein GUJ93_ZPchr0014g47368 [Zizania palustris]|uniref:Thioredoxin domain-containing protein n=1 Tax=Zizania palustris TaxID=103762 RepID=A0A8J5VVC4_ZIZPA|nr:hypothetical protein GUJ93_ZPchr0014g47368 [Zizania palustris]